MYDSVIQSPSELQYLELAAELNIKISGKLVDIIMSMYYVPTVLYIDLTRQHMKVP